MSDHPLMNQALAADPSSEFRIGSHWLGKSRKGKRLSKWPSAEEASDESELFGELDEAAFASLPRVLQKNLAEIHAERMDRQNESAEPARGGESPEPKLGRLRVMNPDVESSSSNASDEFDPTSMMVSPPPPVEPQSSVEKRREAIRARLPLTSNPVTSADLEMLAEVRRENARREAIRLSLVPEMEEPAEESLAERRRRHRTFRLPMGQSAISEESEGDIVPMRHWKNEARRIGMAVSPEGELPGPNQPRMQGFGMSTATLPSQLPSRGRGHFKSALQSIRDRLRRPFQVGRKDREAGSGGNTADPMQEQQQQQPSGRSQEHLGRTDSSNQPGQLFNSGQPMYEIGGPSGGRRHVSQPNLSTESLGRRSAKGKKLKMEELSSNEKAFSAFSQVRSEKQLVTARHGETCMERIIWPAELVIINAYHLER
ncbi:MAG: hypothetical protein M1819_001377 [Sarea resinae]|nr:MAG: hypothetical protein M1819_001377 [Sarea resinae]